MVIVEVTQSNLDLFYEIFSELMREGYGGFPPELREYFLNNDYTKPNFSFWLERNVRKMLLGYHEQQLVGFLVGDHTYGGVAFISWLGIRIPFRGLGLGKELYETYEDYVQGKNAHLIELYTYDGVKPFYEKLGFKEIGRREQGFFGQKNVIMDKKLGDWNGVPQVPAK